MMESTLAKISPLENKVAYACAVALQTVSCILSLCGSSFIIYLIARKNKSSQLFQRIMLGLSASDLLTSTGLLLQPVLLPATSQPRLFAVGNISTCEVSGCLFIVALASYSYALILSFYFYATVCLDWPERKLKRWLEPWMHIAIAAIVLLFCLIALLYDLISPIPVLGYCLWGQSPHNCGVRDDIPCERGMGLLAQLMPTLWTLSDIFLIIGSIYFTWRLYARVRSLSLRSLRHSMTESVTLKRKRAVMVQTCCYTGAATNGLIHTLVGGSCAFYYLFFGEYTDSPRQFASGYATVIISYTFFPLQGFLNCLVYIRPTLARWRDAHPEKSLFWAFQQLVLCRPTPVTSQTTHLMQQGDEPQNDQQQQSD